MTQPSPSPMPLKNCPFCGKPPYTEKLNNDTSEVGCHGCNFFFLCAHDNIGTVWNARTPGSDALKELIEAASNNWFQSDGEESYNNDDVISADQRLSKALEDFRSSEQATPEPVRYFTYNDIDLCCVGKDAEGNFLFALDEKEIAAVNAALSRTKKE